MKSDIERVKVSTEFANAVQQLAPGQSFDTAMDKFLDFALFYFNEQPTETERQQFAETLQSEQGEQFLQAVQLYGKAADDYNDPLGDCMMLKMSRSTDQVFTPKHIAELMAKVTPQTNSEIETVLDTCCGSGRLILGALKKARQNNKPFRAMASDLDLRCVRMTLLNLCINSAIGVVRQANAMSGEVMKTFQITHAPFGLVKFKEQ